MTICKIKARRTIKTQWQGNDMSPYQMDEVEVRPIVITFDVLPPLHKNPNGINFCVDLPDTLELTP